MRITGGKLGGRRFDPPAGNWPTRPTTDFAREGLFNILQNRLDFSETTVLDLFGGTGAHSLECISRGSRDVTYVDKHWPCVRYVENLAVDWGIAEFLKVVRADVARYLGDFAAPPFDYCFAGPPYPLKWLDQIPEKIASAGIVKAGGLFVLEHNPRHKFDTLQGFEQERSYGDTRFSFFSWS